ncbi:hypothetical protein V8B55DRAFT_1557293 [Mucor lusitanicus]|uniref:DUF3752 domain-containing protein n=2 Tax=Mucor circinelloides f. lusitanicus TaxID=29924 RepID=A0A168GEL6_MUCCL|nr:hypothetical protein FB192DRAFT_1461575 [Mucor lusitanicus]OAC97617.1 hypothetical protein MUCCIDRAFT_86883 [Mucor lusitanicus CBS 277.49]
MIGPAIPEALLKKKQNQDEIDIALSDDDDDEQDQAVQQQSTNTNEESIGPQIPQHLLERKKANETSISGQDVVEKEQVVAAGPQIPPHLLQQKRSKTVNATDEIAISDTEEQEQAAGPQIPQHILDKKRAAAPVEEEEEEEDPDVFAPALPPDLLEQRQKQPPPEPQEKQHPGGRRRRPVGPSFPPTGPMPTSSTDQDDFIVGPALPKNYNPEEEAKYSAIQAIEERARLAREAMEQKEAGKNKVERPEWMLVPPEVDYLKKAGSGKSRQFTNKTMAPEDLDSSGWTETPAEKQRRLEEQRLGKRKADADQDNAGPSPLDIERHRNVQQYNMQTRPLTLLEMHQQKKKKDRKTNGLTAEEDVTKRAFDREKDLVGHKRISKKDKDEFLRKSTELGSKFGYGKSSFL